MVMLVHLTTEKLEARIRRSGLRPGKGLWGGYKSNAIYAFPVLPSYTLTHQWTREILKWRRQPLIGVYFRIPDDELVEIGHFNGPHRLLPAAVAMSEIRGATDPRGVQIVLRRVIASEHIVRISPVRGVTGWRHLPDAHQRKLCGCPGCIIRGEPGGRKLRQRYERGDL